MTKQPMFKSSKRWIDAKIAYKITPAIEVFAEARNLGRLAQTESLGAYSPFADGVPSICLNRYAGARYSFGIVLRTM